MGKGSKARPISITANEFWDNWDRVFSDKEEKCYEYHCNRCGGLDQLEVYEEIEINWEAYGDQTVPRPVANLTCEHCGDEVEHVLLSP